MTNIYFDGECPFCNRYVTLLKFRESIGPVRLIDLRTDAAARERLRAKGFNSDAGMSIETEGRIYHGADAIAMISLLTSPSGILNRLLSAIFLHHWAAMVVYPLLRAGRNTTLFLMRRQPIHTSAPEETASFELFARFFGVFAIAHATYFNLRANPLPVTHAVFIAGVMVFLLPRSRQLFLALLGLFIVEGIQRAPLLSNHSAINNFFLASALLGGGWYLLKGTAWEIWFRAIRPIGRSLLVTMYVFGIFHKINSAFLDPDTSCAVALWRKMPRALSSIDNPTMHHLAIYGTFAAEGAILFALLSQRYRHYGIVAGIAFHSLLAFSSYALYSPFSTLSIALHTLFISTATARKITSHATYARFDALLTSPAGIAVTLATIGAFVLCVAAEDLVSAAACWLLLIAGPVALVLSQFRLSQQVSREDHLLMSPLRALNLVSLAFFLNCASPYFGLKTAQAVNMFANIRVEAGISNHLILSSSPRTFNYLDRVAVVHASGGAPQLQEYVGNPKLGLVYYQLLSMLEETPEAVISYSISGSPFMNVKAAELLARDGTMLHSKWFRKFFHFKPVQLDEPASCGRA